MHSSHVNLVGGEFKLFPQEEGTHIFGTGLQAPMDWHMWTAPCSPAMNLVNMVGIM